jgi:mannose-6-phosphate isomerase-like protein (cupin superfamily)
MAGQEGQQLKLFGLQSQCLIPYQYLPAVEINDQVVKGQLLRIAEQIVHRLIRAFGVDNNGRPIAGFTTRWHRLKGTTERYCIISGSGMVEVGELPPQNVTTGDVVIIPPMYRQRITNTGTDDLVFLAICTPRFSNEAYEDIEDTINMS